MTNAAHISDAERADTFALFRHPNFVMIWSASFIANFGTVIQTMAAAWAMAHLTTSTTMVSLVQTALSAPTMVLALLTGATADRFGRRRQMLIAQLIAILAGSGLTITAAGHHLTPTLLLLYTFGLGLAQAIYLPAWQSSIGEQVPRPLVPAAIAFNAVGLNTARCVGPSVGGILLASVGPAAAFGFNSVGFLCVFAALVAWRVPPADPAVQHRPIHIALAEGVRFGFSNPALRGAYIRCAIFAVFAVCPYAFLPLIARILLHGGVSDYTLVQSLFGAGAVTAGVGLDLLRRHMTVEQMAFRCSLLMGAAILMAGLNLSPVLTTALMFPIGFAWVTVFAAFNIATQKEAPCR